MVGFLFPLTLRDVDSGRDGVVNHLAVVGVKLVVGPAIDATGEVLAKVVVCLVNGCQNALHSIKGGVTITCDRHDAVAYGTAYPISIRHSKGSC